MYKNSLNDIAHLKIIKSIMLLQGTHKEKQKIFSKISLILILFTVLLEKSANSLTTETLKGSLINALNANSFSMAPVPITYQTSQIEHYLRITGAASRSIISDLILIDLNVETLNLDLGISYRENTDASNKLSQVFVKFSIPDKNITTTSYDTTRQTRNVWDPNTKTWNEIFDGWRVSNKMQVRLFDLKKVSDLIDKALAIGPILVTSIAFDFSKIFEKKLKNLLLPLAAEDAVKRAKISGEALEVIIDDVKSSDVQEYTPIPIRSRGGLQGARLKKFAAAEAIEAGPEIFAGTSKVDVLINVNFIIRKE